MNQSYKYKAFISYSHKDKVFAKWLHKKIENYAIPNLLREKYPYLPKNLQRSVFRDEDELPTGSVLSNNLTYALNNSEFLIVVCSKNAVKSEWVDKEIIYFKQKHGEESVLAIIKDGEPNNSLNEAFPKALRYKIDKNGLLSKERTEPIAADAKSYFAKEVAFLKIIAGVLKIDFADLWQREKKQKTKQRIILGVLISLFLVLLFYALTQFLGDKTNIELENVKNKIAKIEYTIRHDSLSMKQIVELNEELKKLKKLKKAKEETQKILGIIKTPFGKEVQSVYEKKGAKEAIRILTSKQAISKKEYLKKELSLEDIMLAKLYVEINEFKKAQQSYEDAIRIFFNYDNVTQYGNFLRIQNQHQKALILYEKLLKENISILQKAEIFRELAILNRELHQLQKSILLYEKALNLFKLLSKKNPKTYNKDVALTMARLGEVYYCSSQYIKALQLQKDALIIYKTIKKHNKKEYRKGIVAVYNELFKIYMIKDYNVKKAKSYLLKAIKIQKSFENQNSLDNKFLLANLINNLALSEYKKKTNFTLLYKALKIYEDIANINPAAYAPNVAKQLGIIANEYMYINDIENAEKYYIKAKLLQEKLLEINQNLFINRYIIIFSNLADFYKKTKQYKKAIDNYNHILSIVEDSAIANPYKYHEYKANIFQKLGGLYKTKNQLDKAEEFYIKSLSNYAYLNKNFREQLAITYKLLGHIYINNNQLKKALIVFLKELKIYKELNIENSKQYINSLSSSYNIIGMIYERMKKFNKSIYNYKKSIDIMQINDKTLNQKDNYELLLSKKSLSRVYIQTNDLKNAVISLTDILEVSKKLAKDNHTQFDTIVASTLTSLGSIYIKRKRLNKAKKYFLEALTIYEKYSNNSDDITYVLAYLTSIYLQDNQINKAKKSSYKMLSIYQSLIKKYPQKIEYHVKYASAILISLPISSNPQKDFNLAISILEKYKKDPLALNMLIKIKSKKK